MPRIIISLDSLVVLASFLNLMLNVASCPLDLLFLSFLVIVKVKRGISVLIQLLKTFMWLVMLFFLNICLSFLFVT